MRLLRNVTAGRFRDGAVARVLRWSSGRQEKRTPS